MDNIHSHAPDAAQSPPKADFLASWANSVSQARAAESLGDLHLALAIWGNLARDCTGMRDIVLGRGRALLAMKQFDLAEAAFSFAIDLYPDDVEFFANRALISEQRGNRTEAAERWSRLLEDFPDVRMFDGIAAHAFAQAGDLRRAEAMLSNALAVAPDSFDLRVQHALIAQVAERWTDAAARWTETLCLRPADAALTQMRDTCLWQVQHADAAESDDRNAARGLEQCPVATDAVSANADAASVVDIKTVLGRFESLGDNCEFGLLQRHFGIEPSYLFRFSAIKPEKLVEILDLKLMPLGDAEHMVVETDGEEYILHDRRGYFWMHSFTYRGQIDEALFLKRQQARITVLRRKMLAGLATPGRIYVCKVTHEPISDAMLRAVRDSLNCYGNNVLLGVRLADADHHAGTVEQPEPGLFVGYVSTMFAGEGSAIDCESWRSICIEVDQLYPPPRVEQIAA